MSARPTTAPPTLVRFGAGGLKRMATVKYKPKLFVVAVDGSRLGFRAVRLAAWMIDTSTRDSIKCISVAKGISQMDALQLVKQGEDLLRGCGVPATSIVPGEVLTIAEGASLAATLSKAATGGHLVMGAGGARLQKEAEKRKTSAAAAIGSVANECMSVCKAPVLLAKPKAVPTLDNTRFFQQRQSGSGMVYVVAVDGSHIAQKCFDMALRMVLPGDEVICLHITNTDQNAMRPGAQNTLLGDSAVKKYYMAECGKAGVTKPASSFSFKEAPILGASVSKTILGVVEQAVADLVILGSYALAKAAAATSGTATGKGGGSAAALGSVSAAVAQRTEAMVLVAKHFA